MGCPAFRLGLCSDHFRLDRAIEQSFNVVPSEPIQASHPRKGQMPSRQGESEEMTEKVWLNTDEAAEMRLSAGHLKRIHGPR